MPVDVDPAGAQNGPTLSDGSCVPARDCAGDADATDGEPVGDAAAVASVRVTEGDCDMDAVGNSEPVPGNRETVPDSDGDAAAEAEGRAVTFTWS